MSERPFSRQDLLYRAAQCYQLAGWVPQARQLFIELGEYVQVARSYERQRLWSEAAYYYSQAGHWLNAATCFEAAHEWAPAAEAYLKGERLLAGAWLLAHRLNAPRRATTVIQNSTFEGPDQLLANVILARCEAGQNQPAEASQRLYQVIVDLRQQDRVALIAEIYERAFDVCQVLHRTDLTMMLHSVGFSTQRYKAREQWEDWMQTQFGHSRGIPDGQLPADTIANGED